MKLHRRGAIDEANESHNNKISQQHLNYMLLVNREKREMYKISSESPIMCQYIIILIAITLKLFFLITLSL